MTGINSLKALPAAITQVDAPTPRGFTAAVNFSLIDRSANSTQSISVRIFTTRPAGEASMTGHIPGIGRKGGGCGALKPGDEHII